jgi:hypothetical protein
MGQASRDAGFPGGQDSGLILPAKDLWKAYDQVYSQYLIETVWY